MLSGGSVFGRLTICSALLCGCLDPPATSGGRPDASPDVPPNARTWTFEPGALLGAGAYEHVDLGQGTIAFWLWPKWSGPAEPARRVATIAGWQIGVEGSDVFVEATETAERVTDSGAASGWVRDEPHLIVVRWHWRVPLHEEYLMSLRVDDRNPVFGFTTQDGLPASADTQTFGAPTGSGAAVTHMVVSRRPIHDDYSRTGIGLSRVREHEAIFENGPYGDVAEIIGPWDTLFGTSRYLEADNSDDEYVAWTYPHSQSLLGPGGLFLDGGPGANGWTLESGSSVPPTSDIYGGGVKITYGELSRGLSVGPTQDDPLYWGDRVVLRAVTHSVNGGQPSICVDYEREGVSEPCATVVTGSTETTREGPEELIMTFELPDDTDLTFVRLRLRSNTAGEPDNAGAVWHVVDMQKNMVRNPSFELTTEGAVPDHWILARVDESEIAPSDPNSGQVGLRIPSDDGNGFDAVRQVFEGMSDGSLYAMGAMFSVLGGPADDIAIVAAEGGTFFRHHSPFSAASKMRATWTEDTLSFDEWFHVPTLAKRLNNGEHKNTNDHLHYGNHSSSAVELLVDDAYLFELGRVELEQMYE